MVNRNKINKQLDVDKDELSVDGKKTRNMAKKTTKSMRKNQAHSKSMVESILKTEGITSLQVSAYGRRNLKKGGKTYSSQDHVKCYRNGHETDSDDSN